MCAVFVMNEIYADLIVPPRKSIRQIWGKHSFGLLINQNVLSRLESYIGAFATGSSCVIRWYWVAFLLNLHYSKNNILILHDAEVTELIFELIKKVALSNENIHKTYIN